MLSVFEQAIGAKKASKILATTTSAQRNIALEIMAKKLLENIPAILEANKKDLEKAAESQTSAAILDRLRLDAKRIKGIAEGLIVTKNLPDPLGIEQGFTRPNGLLIRRVKVPLGVIAIVYEARPNVTVEAASLAFKAGNACILRGSSSALNTNNVLRNILADSLVDAELPKDLITLVEDMNYNCIDELAKMRGVIDCIVPRGGRNLIERVVKTAQVPVLETGLGNCHLYVHEDGDLDMALNILINGKTSRPAVCNALETLLIDESIAEKFLTKIAPKMQEKEVELRGCPKVREILPGVIPATEKDWDTEYLDLILAVKVVSGIKEALAHIAVHSTGHSEAIITNNLKVAEEFKRSVDSAAVYVNSSTRFTDGGEFGFGGELGISTQKFHARGPVGLNELTTVKYLIDGNGQVR